MKYEKAELEIEKFESLDIIVASGDDPKDPLTSNDPYLADKW